jgi:hypothetical protein
MGNYLFGWLPVRDVISVVLFATAFYLFLKIKQEKASAKYNNWILGILLWTMGMVFDALRRIEGMGVLRLVEHTFQLTGSMVITYAAYQTYTRVKEVG